MKIVEGRKVIWETDNFIVVAEPKPHISREEGGHMVIIGKGNKYRYDSRLDFTPKEILEVQRLCQMICISYKKAMRKRNINIIRINYFEAGNWAYKNEYKENGEIKPFYHEHIYGRTLNAKKQVFPEAPYLPNRNTGFYDDFEPLNDEDIYCIIEEMRNLELDEKYKKENWNIN